ncbi:hypothetical protein ACQJBY_030188 [Aegilops geniculata]
MRLRPLPSRRRRWPGPPAMGVRTKRDPPPEGTITSIAYKLGNHGLMLLLLETPSGFAILSFDGAQLYLPGAKENIWSNFGAEYMARYIIWLKQFKKFKDKSSAIRSDTGVCRRLSRFIKRWRRPGQMLVVGKPEYKTIIEASMGIPCLFDETVMEVMWGVKHIMHSLVPMEKSELTKEERLPMSQGLLMFLNRKGFDVKPEMVNERIVLSACALYDCDEIEKKHDASLRRASEQLKDVSGINTQGWSLLKLSTALMLICFSEEEILVGEPEEFFTAEELSKFQDDAHEYDDKISKYPCRRIYEELVCAFEARAANRILLTSLVKEASACFSPVPEACKVQPSHIAKNSINSFDNPPTKFGMPAPAIEQVCRTKKTVQPSRWVRMYFNVKLLPHMLTVFMKRELGSCRLLQEIMTKVHRWRKMKLLTCRKIEKTVGGTA